MNIISGLLVLTFWKCHIYHICQVVFSPCSLTCCLICHKILNGFPKNLGEGWSFLISQEMFHGSGKYNSSIFRGLISMTLCNLGNLNVVLKALAGICPLLRQCHKLFMSINTGCRLQPEGVWHIKHGCFIICCLKEKSFSSRSNDNGRRKLKGSFHNLQTQWKRHPWFYLAMQTCR